jgi:hypothetical protein
MDVNEAKEKLRAIIANAKLRHELASQAPSELASQAEAQENPSPATDAAEEERVEQPTPERKPEEPAPDFTDGTWVEVRTSELTMYVEHPGTEYEVRWEVLSGRTLISYRKRKPEDGDADFVVEPPKSRMKPVDPTVDLGSRGEWITSVLPVDPKVTNRSPSGRRGSSFVVEQRNGPDVLPWNHRE